MANEFELIEGKYVEGIIKDLSYYDPDYIKVGGYFVEQKISGYLRRIYRDEVVGGSYWEVVEKPNGLFGIRLEDIKISLKITNS